MLFISVLYAVVCFAYGESLFAFGNSNTRSIQQDCHRPNVSTCDVCDGAQKDFECPNSQSIGDYCYKEYTYSYHGWSARLGTSHKSDCLRFAKLSRLANPNCDLDRPPLGTLCYDCCFSPKCHNDKLRCNAQDPVDPNLIPDFVYKALNMAPPTTTPGPTADTTATSTNVPTTPPTVSTRSSPIYSITGNLGSTSSVTSGSLVSTSAVAVSVAHTFGMQSGQPVTSQTSGLQSGQPMTTSKTSGMQSGQPMTTSKTSGMQSGQPMTTSQTSGVQSGQPMTTSPTSGMQSGQPVTTSPTSGMQSGQPMTTSPTSVMQSGQPMTTSPTSGMQSGQPMTTSPTSGMQSGQLLTPQTSGMQSGQPKTQLFSTLPSTITVPTHKGSLCQMCTESNMSTCSSNDFKYCPETQPYCINKVIQHVNGKTEIVKGCTDEIDCFWTSWVQTNNDPKCNNSLSQTSMDKECNYCCKTNHSSTQPCNVGTIPQKIESFQGTRKGHTCAVGFMQYNEQGCPAHKPFCMNDVFYSTRRVNQVPQTVKRCVSEEDCLRDWWNKSRLREECWTGDLTNISQGNLLCHFCCISNGSVSCNGNTIPDQNMKFSRIKTSTVPPSSTVVTAVPPSPTVVTTVPPSTTVVTPVPPSITVVTTVPPSPTVVTTVPPSTTVVTPVPPSITVVTTVPPSTTVVTTVPPSTTVVTSSKVPSTSTIAMSPLTSSATTSISSSSAIPQTTSTMATPSYSLTTTTTVSKSTTQFLCPPMFCVLNCGNPPRYKLDNNGCPRCECAFIGR